MAVGKARVFFCLFFRISLPWGLSKWKF